MIDFINPTRFSLCLNSVTGSRFLGSGGWVRCSRRIEIRDQSSEIGLQIPESSIQKFRVLVHHLKTKRNKTNQNEIKIKVKD